MMVSCFGLFVDGVYSGVDNGGVCVCCGMNYSGDDMIFSFVECCDCFVCGLDDWVMFVDMLFDGLVIGLVVGCYYVIDLVVLVGGCYYVVECVWCVMIFQVQVGGDDLLMMFYDDWLNVVCDIDDQCGLDWFVGYFCNSCDGYEVMIVVVMLWMFVCGLKMFDFGMGKGFWVGIVKVLGCDFYGFDLFEMWMWEVWVKGIVMIVFDWIVGSVFDLINIEQGMEYVIVF